MPTVKFIIPIKAKKGTSLIKVAEKANVHIKAPCLKGKCQKCIVIVAGDVSAITDSERKAFTSEELEKGYRLACQVEVLGKCKVKLP